MGNTLYIPLPSVSHLYTIPTVQQWVYIENNISYIFPISFSENAYGANATHFGTNNNTSVIVRALDKNHVEIGVGSDSAHFAYVLIYGK